MRKLEEQTMGQRDLIKELKDNRTSLVHHKVGEYTNNLKLNVFNTPHKEWLRWFDATSDASLNIV